MILYMRPLTWKLPIVHLKRVFKTEDSRFIIIVGLKISGISMAISLIIHSFLLEVIRLNHAFFKSHGLVEVSEQKIFFDLVTHEAINIVPWIFIFHIFLFFIGCYAGWLILRPFKTIGDYSEAVLDNPNAIYQIEQFSNYSLLTRYSEFFFEYLREVRSLGSIGVHSIPPQYSRIHKPVFDKVFMLHFGLLLVIVAICSCLFIIETSSEIYLSMVELATNTLKNSSSVVQFFGHQMFIMDDLVWATVILVSLCYVMLGFHLYAKVSGAAFGIFSTMRSFTKGNHSSRVHLLGFAYVRDYTRKLNKYLDYIQKNFSKNEAKKPDL